MLVAARDHQDLVALGAMVSGEYICGEVGPARWPKCKGPLA